LAEITLAAAQLDDHPLAEHSELVGEPPSGVVLDQEAVRALIELIIADTGE
jgi:hypothetical protein